MRKPLDPEWDSSKTNRKEEKWRIEIENTDEIMNSHERLQDCLNAETIVYGGEGFEFEGEWDMENVELYGECKECGREIERFYTFVGVEG